MPTPITNKSPFIEVRGLHKKIGWQHILRGLDLTVYQGETLMLIGPSGEGKSVLLKHLIGLLRPDEGDITVAGTCMTGLRERQLAPIRKEIGILFQNAALFDSMNVAQNVAFPLIEGGLRDKNEINQRVHEALEVVELEKHKDKLPVNLSGGMRKRVGIARAIVPKPHCVLYDEPTSGLDPIVSDVIDQMIKRLQKRYGVTSIVVTHDMKSVFKIADRVALLKQGVIYFLGTPDELRNSSDPVIQDFIDGRSHITC
ncbi:ABC transporter ATP-binding protein [Phragmitibacter flavus]|uniref:ABC transporter ATP-binding protein n=1 Tax=Phragmitibacter flavus TaxID=2576071 RepID=A0A5R8K9L0_9BACT|nr:ABC transporter ATP-binding protein [Phragmitibacter flavus]TLD68199.1 ABC transporter ATP-binding protein [Phragmitibacter flavus]